MNALKDRRLSSMTIGVAAIVVAIAVAIAIAIAVARPAAKGSPRWPGSARPVMYEGTDVTAVSDQRLQSSSSGNGFDLNFENTPVATVASQIDAAWPSS